MKKIYLSGELANNKFVFVDNEDYSFLNRRKWYLTKIGYAQCITLRKSGFNSSKILMHDLIMLPSPNLFIDHVNGNKLDNRKENLRICTLSENQKNRKNTSNSISKYKGVVFHKRSNKWQAQIFNNKKLIYLGLFTLEKEAAIAYNKAALNINKKFYRLNEI